MHQFIGMTSGIRRSLQVATLCVLATATANANLLTNGSFEMNDASASPFFIRSFSSLPGWTQTGNGVDLIHNDYEQPSLPVLVDASDGVQFLDMNQAGALGGIQQIVAAAAGTTYRLRLDATAWATNSRPGTIGFALYNPADNVVLNSGTFSDSVGGQWFEQVLEAKAVSNQIGVSVYGVAAFQAGMGLDNVRLNAVPEPATVWMLGLGAAALIARKRRSSVRR